MLQIFGPDKTVIGLFKDYDGLFKHINNLETSKLVESDARLSEKIWSFALFSNKQLSFLYYKTLERSFSKIGREAVEKELDLLEISKGDFQNPVQIPVTPEVDLSELRKNWCQEYCDAHDYLLVEHHNDDHPPSVGTIPAANIACQATEAYKERHARVHAPL